MTGSPQGKIDRDDETSSSPGTTANGAGRAVACESLIVSGVLQTLPTVHPHQKQNIQRCPHDKLRVNEL